MKRAVGVLLLLFAVWLFALPGARLPHAPSVPSTVSLSDSKPGLAVEHVVQQLPPLQVLRAPLWARLPAAPVVVASARERWSRGVLRAPDLRAQLRRVQTRRRVPRLSAEEPPWC